MLWYYVSSSQERIPVLENRMSALAVSGVLRPTTLIWHEGLESWVSAGEVKPELFLPPSALRAGSVPGAESSSSAAAGPAAAAAPENQGLAQELARTLCGYAGWVEVSGWLHGIAGVLCVAVGTAVGYFAWRRPERLADWKAELPNFLHPALNQPWWTVGVCWVFGIILMFAGLQIMAGAVRTRRAEHLGSVEDLRIALRSMGSFFRTTALTLLLGLLAAGTVLLYQYRPAGKPAPVPASPATPPPPPRDRVTI
ncbi:MAG: DUF4339 domain-containing protein [Verrucomicrobiaceae bacterium]|nr:MAG: DUF4339 domain-containing protein [Verrucomicrobiaceae bacterium]